LNDNISFPDNHFIQNQNSNIDSSSSFDNTQINSNKYSDLNKEFINEGNIKNTNLNNNHNQDPLSN
jgi:hypothetical protein